MPSYSRWSRQRQRMAYLTGSVRRPSITTVSKPFPYGRRAWGRNYGKKYGRAKTFIRGKHRTGGYYGRYRGGGQTELKFHDSCFVDAVVSTTFGFQTSLVLIPQGTTEITRNGRKCTIKKITTKFHIFLPETAVAGDTHDSIRITLLLDTQCNGAIPVIGDIMENTADMQSFRNLANVGRFKTLWARQFNLSTGGGSGRGTTDTLSFASNGHNFTVSKNVNIPLQFDSTAGAQTELQTNNLLITTQTQHGLIGMESCTRVRFTG